MSVSEISHYGGVLAVEWELPALNPTTAPPPPLSLTAATALAADLAQDLDAILGGIRHVGLIVAGALYDQTEILQPGFPLFESLAALYRGRTRSEQFTPELMALGAENGFFPVAAINPLRRPGSGPLLLVPFCLVGPSADIAQLARTMEDTLLQNGQVSPNTQEVLNQSFAIEAQNLSFATTSDLCALLRVQLEAHEFLPLWELLEHGWFARPGVRAVTLDTGNRFLVTEDHLHTLFYTFDDWAQFGPGHTLPAETLETGYLAWVQAQRQYTLTLAAYGLHLRWVLANPALEATLHHASETAALAALRAIPCLSGDYLVERIFYNDHEAPEQSMRITHQADRELGTVAYTVTTLDAAGQLARLEHHYPLHPQGARVIAEQLIKRCVEQNTERQVLHPGRLLYSETSRSLRVATLDDIPTSKQTH